MFHLTSELMLDASLPHGGFADQMEQSPIGWRASASDWRYRCDWSRG
jgi:hypothetical protein